MSRGYSRTIALLLVSLGLFSGSRVWAAGLPAYLPRYRVDIDLDVAGHSAAVYQTATWINPTAQPTDRLVFNVHSRYVVPSDQVGFMAKMVEILRVQPSDSLGYTERPCQVEHVSLVGADGTLAPLTFTFEGDTQTTMVVPLGRPVGAGEAVTVRLDLRYVIPQKHGRWGQWEGVTTLSNWLPVFSYYGEEKFGPPKPSGIPSASAERPRLIRCHGEPANISWQSTPFIPWHQPFFNEAGLYSVGVTLPCDQHVVCSGRITKTTPLPGGKKHLDIEAMGVREFTMLCSARYKILEGSVDAGPGGAPVKIRIAAFEEHEFYAKHLIRIAQDSLQAYSKWLGPYPWPEFAIACSFFGWNGNECSTLVMLDERVFSMPTIAVAYVEYLVSHEICHQWWYNLVGTNGYCETWMDEAMANHFSHRLVSKKSGKDAQFMQYPPGLEWLPNIRRDDYRSSGMYSTIAKGENLPVIQEMPKFGHLVNLFNMCYDKGGRIVGMIEDRLQEAAFIDFSRCVVKKYQYRILGVADYLHELEAYTGHQAPGAGGRTDWREFFEKWLYGPGLSDWSVEKVNVTRSPKCVTDKATSCPLRSHWIICRGSSLETDPMSRAIPPGGVKLHVWIAQKANCDEPTTLGFALPGCEGYPVRVSIQPGATTYTSDDPPAKVTRLEKCSTGGARMLVEVILPAEPTQVAIDPDQVLVDTDPTNNYWHMPIRWRFTPLYTFLEETDLTNAYDKWNVIFGPWMYGSSYQNAWFTRDTMLGARAGLYRTQEFTGGVYAAYRTDYRDMVAGVDGFWDHWPFPHSQVGFNAERRLLNSLNGQDDATRAVLYGRYIFTYGSSLYLQPIHFVDVFAQYTDNFLPYPTTPSPGTRFDRTTTAGVHYRINYLTPYWDPEGGFSFDTTYEAGIAQRPTTVGVQKLSAAFATIKSLPDFSDSVGDSTPARAAAKWLAATRVAVRAYGATSVPGRGEFFSMGGSDLFRGFDLAQRQGSTVWVCSAEWRFPILRETNYACLDKVARVKNVYGAAFYDVGDAYIRGVPLAPVAQAVGGGLRLDVAWFSFVERTTLRVDVARTVNAETGVQVWFGLNQPF